MTGEQHQELFEFALPETGDQLFIQDGDDECLRVDPLGMTDSKGKRVSEDGRWDLYADGFKRAAEKLVEFALSAPITDNLLYPILALYRHSLELRLKALVVQASSFGNDPIALSSLNKTHKVLALWEDLAPQLEHLSQKAATPHVAAARQLIGEFAKLDGDGQSTRYPWDVKDNPSFSQLRRVNIKNLRDTMKKLDNFLFVLEETVAQEADFRYGDP